MNPHMAETPYASEVLQPPPEVHLPKFEVSIYGLVDFHKGFYRVYGLSFGFRVSGVGFRGLRLRV